VPVFSFMPLFLALCCAMNMQLQPFCEKNIKLVARFLNNCNFFSIFFKKSCKQMP